MSEYSSITKPPIFEGKAGEAFVIWEMKFKAFAHERGFSGELLAKFNTRLPPDEDAILDLTIPKEKSQADAIEINSKAIRAMIGAFVKPKDMNKIMAEQHRDPTNWPTGKAYKVWEACQREYQPDYSTSEANMERALAKLKLGKKDNPTKLLDDISAIECCYNQSISENKRRSIIMSVGGPQYGLVIVSNL